jgi:hypothetical protein
MDFMAVLRCSGEGLERQSVVWHITARLWFQVWATVRQCVCEVKFGVVWVSWQV